MSEDSILKEFRVTLETVTPLFLGGAIQRPLDDGTGMPELRPPSIRGALRYWTRAIIGSITGDNLAELKKTEAGVFGNAGDESGRSSPVIVRRASDESLESKPYSDFVNYKDENGEDQKRYGLNYLLFAERELSTSGEKERNGLIGEFDLTFSTKHFGVEGDSILLKAYSALWLLTHLGGLGNRTHRGAGSVQGKLIKTMPKELRSFSDKYPLRVKSSTTDELAKELGDGINFVRRAFSKGIKVGNISFDLPLDILHPDICEINVVKNKTFDSWEDALNSLGNMYKGFRMKRPPDYPMIKNTKRTGGNLPQPVERSVFGLPIPFSDDVLQSSSYDRRTSPLWFHVAKLNTNNRDKYAIVIVWFKSKFLPDFQENSSQPEKLRLIEKNKTEHEGDLPQNNLIETFLRGPDSVKKSSFREKGWKIIEVSL